MLNHRVLWVDTLSDHMSCCCRRRGLEWRPVNLKRPALHVRRSFMRRSRNGVNGDRPNRRMRRRRHAVRSYPVVDNRIIVHFVVINHRRVVIDLGHLRRLETATVQVVPVEIAQVHERESARA